MGYYEQDDGRRALRYAGRVGTGFDERERERLAAELTARRRRSSPFGGRGVQPPKGACFVEPELVAEIEFSHWTRNRVLRHPSYKGLRSDKPAEQVTMELPTAPAAAPIASSPKGRPPKASREVASEPETGGPSRPYEVLHETKRHTEIEVDGRALRLSNREKVLYPRAGFTKGELVDYYAAVAPVLLGHLAGRPLTLKRYPDGVEGQHFYEKRCPSHRPEWVQTAAIWSGRQKAPIDYCLVEDLPTLIWLANLADIELHTSLSRAEDIERPTALVFDLDPGAPAGLRACCRVALWIRELFAAFELQTFVKTSGSKGLQVYLPLNTPVSYEQTKPFARAVAELLEKQHPRLVVSRMTKSVRAGRVLIDWSQNDPHKTTVCVYSLRARERPTISTPLTWQEVERGSRRRGEPELSLEPAALLERVERDGDLFAPLLSLAQTLPELASEQTGRFYQGSEAGTASPEDAAEQHDGGVDMPPRGVKKGGKRDRQYKHIKESQRERGASEARAEEIAARTVNKERARSGAVAQPLALLHERHLLRSAWGTALGQTGPPRAHPRAALPGGPQARHRRPLQYEQGPAAARGGQKEAVARRRRYVTGFLSPTPAPNWAHRGFSRSILRWRRTRPVARVHR